jgi:hypothetical protein
MRGFFNAWDAGMLDSRLWEEVGITANHGFSVELIENPKKGNEVKA